MYRLLLITTICISLSRFVISEKSEEKKHETIPTGSVTHLVENIGDKTHRTLTPTVSKPFPFKDLKDLCKIFGLSGVNCSCSVFKFKHYPKDFCSVIKDISDNKTAIHILIYSPTLSRTYASVTIIASFIGTIGNIAVILVSHRNWKDLSRSRILIAELAVCDLLFGVLQIIQAVPLFWTNKWIYGRFMCKVLNSGMTLGSLMSIGFILLIALERFYGILYYLKTKIPTRVLHTLVFLNVFTGILSVIPLMIVIDVDENLQKCTEIWPKKHVDSFKYNMFLLIVYVIVPIFIIFLLYTKLVLYLKKHSRENKFVIRSEVQLQKRLRQNNRTVCIIISILVAFMICILPNRIIWIYMDLRKYKLEKSLYMALSYIALIPYPLHVAVNAIIYSAIDKKWRHDIWKVLICESARLGSRSMSATTQTSQESSRKTKVSTSKQDMNNTNDVNVPTNKSYGCMLHNMNFTKDEKGRNLSVDQGTSLLSYAPITMPTADEVFVT